MTKKKVRAILTLSVTFIDDSGLMPLEHMISEAYKNLINVGNKAAKEVRSDEMLWGQVDIEVEVRPTQK